MKIKGTGVINLRDYIKEYYPDMYEEWVERLSARSSYIFSNVIFNTQWYDLTDSVLEPSKVGAEMFMGGDYDKFLFETGKYNGNVVLNGIYRFFIKMSSFEYVMDKASLIFETYYSEGGISVRMTEPIEVELKGFRRSEQKWIVNISGWIYSLYRLVTRGKKEFEVSREIEEDTVSDYIVGKIFIKNL
jgi:hypothetical protein